MAMQNANEWYEVFPNWDAEANKYQADLERDKITGLQVFQSYEEAKGYILTKLVEAISNGKSPHPQMAYIMRRVQVQQFDTEKLGLDFLKQITRKPTMAAAERV